MMQQGMQHAKEVETALNTAQQLQHQIQSYQNMVKQGIRLCLIGLLQQRYF